VFDCETTTDLREDLNFLWLRFCELKDGAYVCQREGVVYRDNLDAKSIALIRQFVRRKRADVEDGCPEDISVQTRTRFVNGEFWRALRAGAVIVNFNAPFDLSRLALEFPEAKNKNSGWSTVLWKYQGGRDKLKPYLRIKPTRSDTTPSTPEGSNAQREIPNSRAAVAASVKRLLASVLSSSPPRPSSAPSRPEKQRSCLVRPVLTALHRVGAADKDAGGSLMVRWPFIRRTMGRLQSGVGRSTESITSISTGPRLDSSLRPSCSCSAVNRSGPLLGRPGRRTPGS
jgi:hypothetical protein